MPHESAAASAYKHSPRGPRIVGAILRQDKRDDRDQIGSKHVSGAENECDGPRAGDYLRGGRRLSADRRPQVEVYKRRVAAGHEARPGPAQMRVQAS